MHYAISRHTAAELIYARVAEDEVKEHHIMAMQDWIDATGNFLKFRRKNIFDNSGNI